MTTTNSQLITNSLLIDPPKDSPSVWPLGDPFVIVTRSAITDYFLCIDLPGGRMQRVDRQQSRGRGDIRRVRDLYV